LFFRDIFDRATNLLPCPSMHSCIIPQPSHVAWLVTLTRFRDLPEALLAKGSMESAGRECFLVDDNLVRLDLFISNLVGGVKLQVRAEDVAEATEILNLPTPDASAWVGLPLPLHGKA